MPRVINNFISHNCLISETDFEIQNLIVSDYLSDMSKYTKNNEPIRNQEIYRAILNQLARENNYFKYSIIIKMRERYHHLLLTQVMRNLKYI